MLEFFRKAAKTVVFKIFMGLLLLSFVLSGITGITQMSFTQDYLVKVGSEKITQAAVDQKYDRAVQGLRRSGLDFSDQQLAAMGLSKPQILRDMIQNSLIRQEIEELHIEVSDELVIDSVKNNPQFQINGKFDREKFAYAIGSIGVSERDFMRMSHEQSKNNILLYTISTNAPKNTFIAKENITHYGQKRDIELAIIPSTFNVEVAEPNDEQLKEFYDTHAYQFQIPETRDIKFIRIKKDKANENALYDTTIKIEDALAGGSTVAEIAKDLKFKVESKVAVKADDEELPDLLLATAFDKETGETSDLVFSEEESEYYIVEVEKVVKATIPDLNDVRAKVAAAWKEDASNDANLEFIEEQAEELKKSGESLQSFASKNGYKYEVLKDVRRSDTEVHGARLIDGAFIAAPGEVIGTFQNEDGTYKIAKLKDVRQGELNMAEQEALTDSLEKTVQVEIMDQYFEGLRQKFTVKQKEKLAKAAPDDKSIPVPPKTAVE